MRIATACSYYRGRGAFESMGAGINMVRWASQKSMLGRDVRQQNLRAAIHELQVPGDIAFKCNFAVVEPASQVVLKRRADRHFEVAGPTLCAALDGEC